MLKEDRKIFMRGYSMGIGEAFEVIQRLLLTERNITKLLFQLNRELDDLETAKEKGIKNDGNIL